MWIADPKAISHILQKSGYLYAKPRSAQERTTLVFGRGISWAQGELSAMTSPFILGCPGFSDCSAGEVHKRHRRAMAPAFGLAESKALLPYFMDVVIKARELRL